ATPASASCSCNGIPSFSYVRNSSGSTSSSDFGRSFCCFGAEKYEIVSKSIGGKCRCAHFGGVTLRQCRYADRRHSSSQSVSPFRAEMNRTTSSERPGGSVSDSMSVTKPARYSRRSRSSSVGVGDSLIRATYENRLKTQAFYRRGVGQYQTNLLGYLPLPS